MRSFGREGREEDEELKRGRKQKKKIASDRYMSKEQSNKRGKKYRGTRQTEHEHVHRSWPASSDLLVELG